MTDFAAETSEFSFTLKPCAYGVGVFAAHPIARGAHLRLCGDDREEISRRVPRESVAGAFLKYCLDQGDGTVIRPSDFGQMHLVWYLNHSDAPNAAHRDYVYYALRDIEAGEEIFIDYGTVEPGVTATPT